MPKKSKKTKGKEAESTELNYMGRPSGVHRRPQKGIKNEFHWRESEEALGDLEETRPSDFCIIKDGESVTEALKRMDKHLVSSKNGNSKAPTFFTTTIPRGRLGLAQKRGTEPIFFGSGTYMLKGLYVKWTREKVVALTEPLIINHTVSIITLTDRDGAVVREGSNLRTLGKGRYIIREPLKLLHMFNESDFEPILRKRTTLEGTEENRLLGRQLGEGDAKIGCRFIQVAPGCCAVVQVGHELVVFPEGWYRLKSLDHSVSRWLDLREVSNTVINIGVTTSNQAQMTLDVYVRCRLDDPIVFTEACEYSDMQDALDDKAIDVLQRLVGSRTYASIIEDVDEAEDSFDAWISRNATERMRPYAEQLGGELLEISVVRRRFDKTIQTTLDKQAEKTLELETKRLNMEKAAQTQKREAEARAERERIRAQGEAEAMRIEASANRERVEQEAMARAKAIQEMAAAYTNVADLFAREALQNELQVKKFEALGDKAMIIPSDLALNAASAAVTAKAGGLALGMQLGGRGAEGTSGV